MLAKLRNASECSRVSNSLNREKTPWRYGEQKERARKRTADFKAKQPECGTYGPNLGSALVFYDSRTDKNEKDPLECHLF